jgi:hypothetical protein
MGPALTDAGRAAVCTIFKRDWSLNLGLWRELPWYPTYVSGTYARKAAPQAHGKGRPAPLE